VLAALYTRYASLIFGVCMKYLQHPQEAEDAAMDIYIQLGPKLLQHDVTQFRGWLAVLVRNHCLMALRKAGRSPETEITDSVMYSASDEHPLEKVLEKENTMRQLEQCIESLTPEQQQSVRLFYLEKKCYQTIANETGYAWNQVRSYIQNGRRNLKNCLDKSGVAH
jgi:RNA polymerase sigma-70 factor (ECF subfamily)